MEKLTTFDSPWIIIGFIGQSFFFSRFLVQWIASERRGRSTIPNSFWYFSIAGSALLLAYAIYRLDPVFILGQSVNQVVYVRNLILIKREEGLLRTGS
jgi:lipid-A-disaccharide synthase-like uncharacterized protein